MEETRPLLLPHGYAHDKPRAARLRPHGRRALPSGMRFASRWARPVQHTHAISWRLGPSATSQLWSGRRVSGAVGVWCGAVRLGVCMGFPRAWSLRGMWVPGGARMSLGLPRAWDLTQPATSMIPLYHGGTRMGQHPATENRPKRTPTAYAGPISCLRCDTHFRAGTGGRTACVMPAGRPLRSNHPRSHPILYPSPGTCPRGPDDR